jgi:hypothetical protein
MGPGIKVKRNPGGGDGEDRSLVARAALARGIMTIRHAS